MYEQQRAPSFPGAPCLHSYESTMSLLLPHTSRPGPLLQLRTTGGEETDMRTSCLVSAPAHELPEVIGVTVIAQPNSQSVLATS